MSEFEEDYLDVLQNIESAIISVYREHTELLDFQVENVLNALILAYQAEQQSRSPNPARFSPLEQEVHDRVRTICEWRLGRENLSREGIEFAGPERLSLEEISACLKRIRKSVQKWSRREGRQGYLRFVDEFIQ
jgi:hypothetical protein